MLADFTGVAGAFFAQFSISYAETGHLPLCCGGGGMAMQSLAKARLVPHLAPDKSGFLALASSGAQARCWWLVLLRMEAAIPVGRTIMGHRWASRSVAGWIDGVAGRDLGGGLEPRDREGPGAAVNGGPRISGWIAQCSARPAEHGLVDESAAPSPVA